MPLLVRPSSRVAAPDATAHDHPRRAGLALHLGAELDLPHNRRDPPTSGRIRGMAEE